MPASGETKQSSFRFTPADLERMDRLAPLLALSGLPPLSRTDVLRVALARLEESMSMDSSIPKKKR